MRAGRQLLVVLVVLAGVGIGGCAGLGSSTGQAAGTSPGGVSDRLILLTVEQRDFAVLDLTGSPSSRYLRRRGYGAPPAPIDRVLDQIAREHDLDRLRGWPIESLGVYCEVLEVPDGQDVAETIERLRADPRVDLAQPMHAFETLAGGYDDPYLDLQSAALDLAVADAHRLATGVGVLVAVVDTAVDASHPDLRGRVALERDLVGARRKPLHGEVHGTAIAGVIASTANNREGIVGVAPAVRVAALRACWPLDGDDSRARCSSFTLALALETALSVGAAVINLSLAGPPDPLLARLLDEAVARDVVVVAAAPDPDGVATFPASHRGVLVAQAASAPVESLSRYRLPAPAAEILTTIPDAGYAFFSGTSLAAAHLSGVVALMLERAPGLGIERIVDVLAETTVRRADRSSVNACYAVERLADAKVCAPAFEVANRVQPVRSGL